MLSFCTRSRSNMIQVLFNEKYVCTSVCLLVFTSTSYVKNVALVSLSLVVVFLHPNKHTSMRCHGKKKRSPRRQRRRLHTFWNVVTRHLSCFYWDSAKNVILFFSPQPIKCAWQFRCLDIGYLGGKQTSIFFIPVGKMRCWRSKITSMNGGRSNSRLKWLYQALPAATCISNGKTEPKTHVESKWDRTLIPELLLKWTSDRQASHILFDDWQANPSHRKTSWFGLSHGKKAFRLNVLPFRTKAHKIVKATQNESIKRFKWTLTL